MTIGTNQFWTLLEKSRLVELPRIHTLNRDFLEKTESRSDQADDAKFLAQWLVKQNAISVYQAKILLGGRSGPMWFGRYIVTDRIDEGPRKGTFKAIHQSTAYCVNLQFVKGTEQADLHIWREVEALTDRVCGIVHPNLVAIFEANSLSNHRFIASENSIGTPLSALVPRKGRLPWQDACSTLAQVAFGLQELHELGIVHSAISPNTIWLEGGGRTRLMLGLIPEKHLEPPAGDEHDAESRYDYIAPESLSDNPQVSSKSDFYAIGCTLYRMVSGKPVFPTSDLEKKIEQHRSAAPNELGKYEIPPGLQSLLNEMLSKDPAQRPESAQAIGQLLAEFAGKPDLLKMTVPPSDGQREYCKAIKPSTPVFELAERVEEKVAIDTGETGRVRVDVAGIERTSTSITPTRKPKWQLPLAILSSCLALTGIMGWIAYQANQQVLHVTQTPSPADTRSSETDHQAEESEQQTPPDLTSVNLIQELFDDDGTSLWESPTTGLPLDFSYLPPAAKLIFAFKPSELWAKEEGRRIFQSLGPQLVSRIEKWKQEMGLEFEDMAQVIMSFHSGSGFDYDPYFVVRLTEPTTTENLRATWNDPVAVRIDDNTSIYEKTGDRAFYIIPEPVGELTDAPVWRFAFGSTDRIREAIESGGSTALSGTTNKLSRWSDAARQFTFIFSRQSLFNEQGQSWMSGQMATFNRQLDLFLQDEIRGGMLSIHLDNGAYIEIVFDQTVDLEPLRLKESMEQRLRIQRDEITQFLTTIPASRYWDKVRLKYDNMLSDVYRQFRWNVEHNTVIGNGWLPPMAGHNLIAASELLTAYSHGVSVEGQPAVSTKMPQTIEELLNLKRSLDISTNPDLNILLAGIRVEVLDDFDNLPFEFNIRLIGNDLEKEGITQNQQPGDFKIDDKTLAEILTEIMVRCNPSKDISGPEDPNCKLVWAIGSDPANPVQQAILITTREGAANKGLTLPDAFVGRQPDN